MGRIHSNVGFSAAVILATLSGTVRAQDADEAPDDEWFEIAIEREAETEAEPEAEQILNPYEGDDAAPAESPRRSAAAKSASYASTRKRQALSAVSAPTEEQLAKEANARAVDEASTAFAAGAVIAFVGTLSLFGVAAADANNGGLDGRGQGEADLMPGYIGAGLILVVGHVVALPPLTILITAAEEKNKGVATVGPSGIGYYATF